MYQYKWDTETGGLLLTTEIQKMSKEPRPVYYKELDILGFDKYFKYPKNDNVPIMWAELNDYIYRGEKIATISGGSPLQPPKLKINENISGFIDKLVPVDIEKMIEKNHEILNVLSQEAISKIYNTYLKYRNKVDLFYVAFSGGKDSIVALDLIQRSLPHDDIKVIFGDTRMEFSDTYDVVDKIQQICAKNGIEFYTAKSDLPTDYTWNEFGPPAQRIRWCCSVHKTSPQILLLRKITNNPMFRGMAFTGVRADESVNRSQYDEISFGDKHKGQFSYHTILHWNSAEVYIYIYANKLLLNQAYKKGNSRAGCLVCPMATARNIYFKEVVYGYNKDINDIFSTYKYNQFILNTSAKQFIDNKSKDEFIDTSGWKARRSGRELNIAKPVCIEEYDKNNRILQIRLLQENTSWKQWIKTLGIVDFISEEIVDVLYKNKKYVINIRNNSLEKIFELKLSSYTKDDIYFMSALKIVIRKAGYCIGCKVCEANCPYGYISFVDGNVLVDNKCVKCHKCHDVFHGCLVANSLRIPKEEKKMSSIDRYSNFGVEFDWIVEFFEKKDHFWDDNGLGPNMIKSLKAFLSDGCIIKKNRITDMGSKILNLDIRSDVAWAVLICNLAYTSEFNWWINNITFNKDYLPDEIKLLLGSEMSENSKKNVLSAYKNIFMSNEILSNNIRLGICVGDTKYKSNGGKTRILKSVRREAWIDPVPEVILYSLYKFAEECGNHYQFTMSSLLDDSIERDGISPSKIFGIDANHLKSILNGLSINYPEYINVSFSLDLDNITLYSDKKSENILDLL